MLTNKQMRKLAKIQSRAHQNKQVSEHQNRYINIKTKLQTNANKHINMLTFRYMNKTDKLTLKTNKNANKHINMLTIREKNKLAGEQTYK